MCVCVHTSHLCTLSLKWLTLLHNHSKMFVLWICLFLNNVIVAHQQQHYFIILNLLSLFVITNYLYFQKMCCVRIGRKYNHEKITLIFWHIYTFLWSNSNLSLLLLLSMYVCVQANMVARSEAWDFIVVIANLHVEK